VLPLAYLAAYFVGYQRPGHHPAPSFNPLAVGRVAGEVLAMSLGIAASPVWWAVFAGMLALGRFTLARLVRRWKEPGERLSIIGLIAVAAGVTGVAVAIGVGRGAWGGGMGLWSRYSLLAWPLLAMAYLAWVKLGGKWVPIALCVAAALAFPGNTFTGMQNGAAVKSDYSAIAVDAALHESPEKVVQGQFSRSHHAAQAERAVRAIPMLRAAGIGIFAR
jgi:hypothetical protein